MKNPGKSGAHIEITRPAEWKEHYQKPDHNISTAHGARIEGEEVEIKVNTLEKAVKNLKYNKASGPEEIVRR